MRFVTFLLLATLVLAAPMSGAAQEKKMNTKTKQAKAPTGVRIFNPDALAKPTVGYSQVAEVTGGKVVYIAGQISQDKNGNLVGKDDFRAQVTQVFDNLKAAVEAAGGTFHDVVKLNYYCAESVDPSQIPVVREVRDKYINTANPPTSTFVVVKRLVRPEWMIEVEAVAVVQK